MTARGLLGRTATLAILCLGATIVLVPFAWMISLSLKPAAEIFSPDFTLLPAQVEWRNYVKAFTEVPLHRFLLNGVIVCFGILFFQLLLAVPLAYALAVRDFKLRGLLFGLVLAGLLVP